ncbi:MAG: hypothetical protein SPI77_07165 [Corynebacterium sp.]|nr:hypothetical protein [Corynebacterium sp.]
MGESVCPRFRSVEELIQLVAMYQVFVGESRRVGLIMAGLPHPVSALLSHRNVSFLRRAQQRRLGQIPDVDVKRALLNTISDGGRSISPAALTMAVDAIAGFAFMLQLVG